MKNETGRILVVAGLATACSSVAPSDDSTAGPGEGSVEAMSSGAGGAALASIGGVTGSGASGSAMEMGGSKLVGGAAGAAGANAGTGGAMSGDGCMSGAAHPGPNSQAPNSQAPGTWIDVTPPGLDLTGGWLKGPSPIGAQNVVVDPANPSDVYLFFEAYGIFKSTDYGMTYKKISTGNNSEKVNAGRPWSVSFELDPCRDPKRPPTLYINAGFGADGLWKSTDGGVSFTNVFADNIYATDGTTNISSHVGGDVANAFLIDPTTTDHLVLFMHGEPDTSPDYKGLFETTDGGKKWILHKSDLFVFAPHSDGFAPIDPKTWIVGAGTLSPSTYLFRSTDAGMSWSKVDGPVAKGMVGGVEAVCFQWCRAESAIYTESTSDGIYKTTDKGASWTKVAGSGSVSQWVVATKKMLYASNGNPWDTNPILYRAPLDHDTAWQTEPFPAGMITNGVRAAVTFDGSHSIIIAAQHKAGAWRYVEP
jgi:hypothetical protein